MLLDHLNFDVVSGCFLKRQHLLVVCIDRKEAVPRFVRKPRNQVAAEGQTAKFDCKIIAASAPIITWSVLLCGHVGNFSLSVCLCGHVL